MQQKDTCGCGHDHAHHPDHDHGSSECGCGCGHAHIEIEPVEDMSVLQQNVLLGLYERKFLPVARFIMASSRDEAIRAVALEPVYIGTPEDDMDQVKALGGELDGLMRGGLITLDYDMPLGGYAYREYDDAQLYRYFKETVQAGSALPGALFDRAILEKGSMALTDAGAERVEAMLGR